MKNSIARVDLMHEPKLKEIIKDLPGLLRQRKTKKVEIRSYMQNTSPKRGKTRKNKR